MSNGEWETFEIYKLLGGGAWGEGLNLLIFFNFFSHIIFLDLYLVYEAQTEGYFDPDYGENIGRRYVAVKFLKKYVEDKEILVLRNIHPEAFRHKNLVRYRSFHPGTELFRNISTSSNAFERLGLVIMDVARYGAAIDWILKPFRNKTECRYYFTDRVSRRMMRDIISGLAHLSRHHISHRDMKGDNIFLDGQGR
jgi:serine/threonine protein kinase